MTKKNYAEILTGYSYGERSIEDLSGNLIVKDGFDITLNLKELTGKNTLNELQLTLLASKDKNTFDEFFANISMLSSFITINLHAKLNEYDGSIEYGIESDIRTSDLLEMPTIMAELILAHSEWQ